MKRVLGLDLGSSSIGWAIIEENSEEVLSEEKSCPQDKIIALGSRIIPLSTDESTQFSRGLALTKNADRTKNRTQRKGYDRYQLRRAILLDELNKLGMYNGETLKLSALELWGLRAKAIYEKISLLELGRVLSHLNQKRGYRTSKSDYGDKKQGEYIKQVVDRHRKLIDENLTIGQYMYNGLKNDSSYRCKEQIFPRNAYMEEFDKIMESQQQFYPEILTNEKIEKIRNEIIYYQRPLKSCKHLVSRCELERRDVMRNGKIYNCGPRVAPRSSPLFQICKIWESINNLCINNKYNDTLHITLDQKLEIFNFMNSHDKLKASDLKTILNIKTKDWLFGKAVGTGLQGNTTYCTLKKALGKNQNINNLLRFDIKIADSNYVDTETGEIAKIIDASFEKEPLYILWHTLYSISNIDDLKVILKNNFGIDDEEVIDELCKIDFVKSGYSNKSSRAIRKILPYLQEGQQYFDAKLSAGYNDVTLTKEQNQSRELLDRLMPIQKGELRQPVVEKVLNQLVNLVNALMEEYGRFDDIRIELARELKQNKEERESATKSINNNKRQNDEIAERIKSEYSLTPTLTRIQKYKMWQESNHICMYCSKTVDAKQFLIGSNVEVEHIIPKSILFDNSFSNKVCSCQSCNREKNNRTAYDYMKSKGEESFNAYITRINNLADENKISKTKLKNLLMTQTELPTDFIERQLRETQYISKKAKEILNSVCYNVYATSGSITDYIRHIWGWDEILHTLNFNKYRDAEQTEQVEREINGKKIQVERIANWSKRMDHRHHAIDALAIACTKQGYIQRINNLNSLKELSFTSFSDEKQDSNTQQRSINLERYIKMQPHFSTAEVTKAVERIAISFKSGKRTATLGKRYIHKGKKRICVQDGIIIPRGALSEESVYGRIFNNKEKKHDFVIKYKLGAITLKDIEYIVDKGISRIIENRLKQFNGKSDKAFAEPLLDHQGNEIRSVRCYTGLKSTVPLRYNEDGEPYAYVKPGNNHHIAIYEDEKGKMQEHTVTFWHAVERKKYGIPTIITNPTEVWDSITEKMPESFLNQLPPSANWKFKLSMQQNEMFILGMDDDSYNEAINNNDYATLSKHLYRVQKISHNEYVFRHHLETSVDDKYNGVKNLSLSMEMGKMIRISSLKGLQDKNPHKVHVSLTGKIREI